MAPTLQDLRQDDSLWWRITVFLFDLRHFKEKAASQARLDDIVDASHAQINWLPGGETLAASIRATLDERLERRIKKRAQSSDYRVCAAHDLVPVFEEAFEAKPKELARNQKFVDLVETYGLEMPSDWRSVFAKVNRCGPKPRLGKKKSR
ncbi:hypothetical protein B9Z65_7473 [Elsinoe australis]|uniref:Uncharacterized protein n=1 Tax=Elsinoe australis TaxID=40998 RepID=A0A2P7YCA0_9PEZI|nr:hypothetical protein B9Z65_7473 [Elsinoe australis]